MTNTFGNGVYNPAYWAAEMEGIFQRENIAMSIANLDLRSYLKDGDTVHKAYGTYPTTATYTKGTAITIPDYSGTDEYLTVDTAKVAPMYIDDIDIIQNKWNQADVFAARAGRALNNVMEQAVMAQYSNARQYISAGDMGGSGTGTFTASSGNIEQLFAVASRKLNSYDVGQSGRFAIVGSRLQEYLRLYVAGRETGFGDTVGANGMIGKRFGFDIIYSNNLPFSAKWTPSDQPSDSDTLTIAGVTFTWETSTLTTAGQVKSETDVATSLDNLVAFINNDYTSGTEGYDLTARNRWLLDKYGIVATDGTTYLGIVGYGDIVVACSESNDAWSEETQRPLFGIKGAINMVVQKSPNVVFKEVSNMLGRNVFVWNLYGLKTFEEDKDALVYAKVNTHLWA